ncbi:unnamed protein product [Orchesella dallaii]|uniref:Uncharacterized protein n=1 Tax=Orchesella dallaii TaxID=48710 RepID=A0ABP1S037_9HEXA
MSSRPPCSAFGTNDCNSCVESLCNFVVYENGMSDCVEFVSGAVLEWIRSGTVQLCISTTTSRWMPSNLSSSNDALFVINIVALTIFFLMIMIGIGWGARRWFRRHQRAMPVLPQRWVNQPNGPAAPDNQPNIPLEEFLAQPPPADHARQHATGLNSLLFDSPSVANLEFINLDFPIPDTLQISTVLNPFDEAFV